MEALITDPVLGGSATPPSEVPAPPSLGRDEFLKLLIAQLENQDPLQPAENTEFISQLATFSALEQQILTNDNLEGIAVGQASLINSQALDLIGREALIEAGDEIRISQGSPEQLVYAIPRPAQSATLTVYGADGTTPVRVIELEQLPSGRLNLEWDGTDEEGNLLQDGSYRIELNATDLNGEPMAAALFKSLPIDGVIFDLSGIFLVSSDQQIPYDQILEIRADQS